jgi:hypothetical protein
MASKRKLRRRACEGKVRFESRDAAERKRRFVYRDYNEKALNVYKCRFCGGWHLGHSRHHPAAD